MGLSVRSQAVVAHLATAIALTTCVAAILGVGHVGRLETGERTYTLLERGDFLWTAGVDDGESAAAVRSRLMPAIERAESIQAEPRTSWHDRRTAPVMSELPDVLGTPEAEAAGAPPESPVAKGSEAEPAIAGVWVPDANTCSLRGFRDGLLPTIINNDGAWAGETFCLFKNRKQIASGWQVAADCAGDGKQWNVLVRLTLKGRHLIWESRHGRQVYTRCAPDLRMAETP